MTKLVKSEDLNARLDSLKEKSKNLPTKPGCYLMLDNEGNVIYVGKAKSLRSRVLSYFSGVSESAKTQNLVRRIENFEFILAGNEVEALVLENNLIKKYSPKYNIRLKDDKSYPYIVVDRSEPFPQLKYLRRVKRTPEKTVFGPFVTGSNLGQVLRILIKCFELRDCNLREFHSRKEPCLLYQMEQCSAPCVNKIDAQKYEQNLQMAQSIFSGKPQLALEYLEKKMIGYANNEAFEKAACIRDYLETIKNFLSISKQHHAEAGFKSENVDVWGISIKEEDIEYSVYIFRGGLLLGHKNYNSTLVNEETSEVLGPIIRYYEDNVDEKPTEIILAKDYEHILDLYEISLEKFDLSQTKIRTAKNCEKSFVQLATNQAIENQRLRLASLLSVQAGLKDLQKILGLDAIPRRLECYDVAVWQGSYPTAAQITFLDGLPDKKKYRHYHLQELPEGNNDFSMLRTVLARRLKKSELPDIFIVDGGVGQVNAFKEVLRENNLAIPVVGIAKSKVKGDFRSAKLSRSLERLVIPGRSNPFNLTKTPELMRIIVSMRNEAHRFSRRLHHKKFGKEFLQSWFDKIDGVGPKLKKEIINKLSEDGEWIYSANKEEIAERLKIGQKLAQNIYLAIKNNQT